MPKFQRLNTIALIITAALLTACGGSSGGSGSPPPETNTPPPETNTPPPETNTPPPETNTPPPETIITLDNAPLIAAAVYQTVITADDVAGLTAPPASGSTQPLAAAKSPSSVMAVNEAEAEDCLESGRASVTFSDQVIDNLTSGLLAPGDRFEFGFENCDDGDGFITDGNFDILVTSFSGDYFDLYRLGSDVTMTDFALTFGDETITLNADMSIDFNLLNFPAITIEVSGGNIDEFTDRINAADSSTSLTDFTITTTIDETNPDVIFETEGSGALMNSDFDGEVMFNITTTLTSTNNNDPTSGVILISGGGGASITITALSSTQVQLEIDLGDGSAVVTRVLEWAVLRD